jgi:hypothetical protein
MGRVYIFQAFALCINCFLFFYWRDRQKMYTYITCCDGPLYCLADRYSILQMKVTGLKNHSFLKLLANLSLQVDQTNIPGQNLTHIFVGLYHWYPILDEIRPTLTFPLIMPCISAGSEPHNDTAPAPHNDAAPFSGFPSNVLNDSANSKKTNICHGSGLWL